MAQSLYDQIQAAQQMKEQGLYTEQEYWDVLFDIIMSDKHADFLENLTTIV